jgi:[protein-PII] uridylyltransferase
MAQITRTIERALGGEVRIKDLMAKRKPAERRITAFTVEPEAIINNALSDQFSVIEVSGRDRPGLLYDLTSAISDLNLDITSAHITTYGEKAVDVFYVTDLTGKKVTSEQRQAAIRERLIGVLSRVPETA